MKQIIITGFILFIIAFLLPILAAGQTMLWAEPSPSPTVGDETPSPSPTPPLTPTPKPTPIHHAKTDAETTIIVLVDGDPVEMTLNEYLYGVVSCEMPVLYPSDALRAQAVAARTYALRTLYYEPHHDNAAICNDYTHCMAYRPLSQTIAAWGPENGEAYADKIREAVHSTDGQTLQYDGFLIDALFFAISSGQTETASDVWAADIPYLQGVDSSWDTESPDYPTEVILTYEELKERLLTAFPEIDLSGKGKNWLGEPERSPSGGITSIMVGDVEMHGLKLREICGLRSHNFTWEIKDKSYVFSVKGYGHGVGLSQFGARQMALSGHDYRDILHHYYTGVEIAEVKKSVDLENGG